MLKQTTYDDMKFFLDLKGQSMSDVTGGATDNITLENYSEKLGFEVKLASDVIGESAKKLAAEVKPGEAILLENLRFHAEEEKNDPAFA